MAQNTFNGLPKQQNDDCKKKNRSLVKWLELMND
jgi:hypothetical protein